MRAVAPAIALAALVSCSSREQTVSAQAFLLDTFVSVKIYDCADQSIADGCVELCRELEGKLSRTLPGSDIYRLNHAGGRPVELSDDAATALSIGLRFGELSGGLFDVTIAPLSEMWDFGAEEPSVPDPGAIAAALRYVGWNRVSLDGNTATLEPGMGIDLGGVAKGYIADRMAQWLSERGVGSAVIDLGGNIYALGEKPGGAAFTVGITNPLKPDSLAGTLSLRGLSAVTSGTYQRCFTVDGEFYHHILDPRTGYPFQGPLASVTIISKSSAEADALSTACFLLGEKEGTRLALSLGAEAVFIGADGAVSSTPGAQYGGEP